MAIQIRRGNQADLVAGSLSQGEPFICLDTKVAGVKGNEDAIYLANGDSSGNANGLNKTIAGLPFTSNIALAQLIAAGLAAGTDGKADTSALADNALKLGGADAANFPQMSNGTWTPTLAGYTTTGAPTYSVQGGTYKKVGNLLYFDGTVALTSKGGMAGILMLGGLPFSVAGFFLAFDGNGYTADAPLIGGHVDGNIGYFVQPSTTGAPGIDVSKITDSFTISIRGIAALQ